MTRTLLIPALVILALPAFAQVERGAPLPRKPSFGAQIGPLSEDEAKAAGLPATGGAKIMRLLPGQTAEAVGLKVGDILVSIEGKKLETRALLTPTLNAIGASKPVQFEVLRDGKVIPVKGTLRERPKQKEDGFKVVYDQVLSKGKRIRVIATHPEGKGPFPTVFLIGGIGAYSVDGDWEGVAYGTTMGPISKAGYATVRIDKPGQGDSEGPAYTELLFDDELDAYLQSLRLAKTLPFVDKEKIAIFGHSMGGAFGPILAAQEPVKAIAVNGTVTKTWVEYQLENTRRQSLLAGGDPVALDGEMKTLAAVSHYLFNEGLSPKETKEKHPHLAAAVDAMTPDGKTMSGVGLPFFQQLAKKNLVEAWCKTDAKVLALWGENEFISTKWDHEFLADILNARKPGQAEFKILPQSDHGFKKTTSVKDSFQRWGQPGGEFNPNVVETLKEWFAKVLG